MVSFSELNWKKVLTSDRVTVGTMQGGEADMKTWQITHIHIGLNDATARKFGLKKPYLGQLFICLPISDVEAVNGTIRLKSSLDQLKKRKECREFKSK